MLALFPNGFFPGKLLRDFRNNLDAVKLEYLVRYNHYADDHQAGERGRGPDIQALRNRASISTATQRQHNIAGSRNTVAELLPRDLTEEEHISESHKLEHPFDYAPDL